jgi:broad specificity phosphatase PhoE
MNEYLGRSLSFGAPGFSDVFENNPKERITKYQDTPLSPNGIKLVQQQLARRRPEFLNDDETPVDLVVVSPLRRALQTYDLGLRPHLEKNNVSSSSSVPPPPPPVVALPYAAERLYLISDVGSPVHVLEKEYPYVDFSEIIVNHGDEAWWWTPAAVASRAKQNNGVRSPSSSSSSSYMEWRPTGRGQKYACPGEPYDDFSQRMDQLHQWLNKRKEQKIVVVCHHGVIDHMLDMDFDNCQWRQVPFSQLLAGAR